MFVGRILVRNLAHTSVTFKVQPKDTQPKWRLERDEYGAKALDFVENVCLRLI